MKKQINYCLDLEKKLKQQKIRAITDIRNEKIGFKIRQHSLKRHPYLIIIGDKEVEANKVAVRKRGGEDLGQMSIDDFVRLII